MEKQKIGQGSYGSVYKIDKNTVAKEVNLVGRTNLFINKLIRANELALTIQHKNVLGIKNFEIVKGDHTNKPEKMIIYMEYIAGVELDDYVIKKKHQMLDIFYQLADGLEHMHANNIAHRDIKPSNIVVKNNIPFILDFDMICVKEECIGVSGTPYYIDPNMYYNWKNKREIDYFASDVYALIVTMFIVANKKYPWFNSVINSTKEVLFEEKKDVSRSKWTVCKTGIEKLDKMLKKGLDPDDSKRLSLIEIKELLGTLVKEYT